MESNEIEFLKQSNWIEAVYDPPSLDDAVRAWKFLKKQKSLDIDVVEVVHRILMKRQSIPVDELGCYRKSEVMVSGVIQLKAILISQAMDVWFQNVFQYPEQWKDHHIQFEKIHPFIDGNGRVGRMLMNWERLRAGLPILVIRGEDRPNYLLWFK